VIPRALVHVGGPAGTGKTTFIERLLDAQVAFAISVRAQRNVKLRKERESARRNHAELRRYRDAGASAVALYCFAQTDPDRFYASEVMEDYSEAVFIEGDCPVDFVDLSVFVAKPPVRGQSLLDRVIRDHTAAHEASLDKFEQALANPEATGRLLATEIGAPFLAKAFSDSRALEDIRQSMTAKLASIRRAPPPPPTKHWSIAPGYAGIERAQLVIVNVRSGAERERAEPLLTEITRLRKDEDVYRDVIGFRGNRLPITAVLADLADRKDPGLKKAVARVKRATKQRYS
jgi:hypothetical protein